LAPPRPQLEGQSLIHLTTSSLALWLPTVGCRVGLGAAIAVTILFAFCFFYAVALGSNYFFMDVQDDPSEKEQPEPLNRKDRTFEPLLERFNDIAKTIIGLAAASLTIFSAYVGYAASASRSSGSGSRSIDLYSVQLALAFPITWLFFSIFYLVFFMALLTARYEEYLHRPNSYTRPWYACVLGLGMSGLLCFVLGFAALGFSVLFSRIN
jgi:hypothetical protein